MRARRVARTLDVRGEEAAAALTVRDPEAGSPQQRGPGWRPGSGPRRGPNNDLLTQTGC